MNGLSEVKADIETQKGQTVLTHAAKPQGLREDYVSTAKKPEERQSVCLTPQTSKL